MTDESPDDPVLDDEARAALPVVTPPDGFAERVMARVAATPPAEQREAQPAPARRPPARLAMIMGAITVAAIVALVVLARPGRDPRGEDRGELTAERRSTVPIGHRGLAVVEAGGALSFGVVDGRTLVDQTAGDVFYRVAPSSKADEAFVVRTPAGEVVVRGTCFRVEVMEMKGLKQAIGGAAVGAGVTALVLVTVYEGKVRFANAQGQTEVAAGERVVTRAGSAPGPAVDVARGGDTVGSLAQPPPPTATREELLARDEAQRKELAGLRSRVRQLELAQPGATASQARDAKKDERPFYDPGPEELRAMAARCELRWDAPSLDPEEHNLSPEQAAEMGISEEERVALNKSGHDFQVRVLSELRQIYLEVTGDTAGAEELSASSLIEEITRKSSPREVQAVFQRLSAERAGLAAPPADPSRVQPFERMMRLITGVGDEAERLVGKVIGPERAHQLRAARGGWGSRHTSNHGCPEE